jgi:hypothetical protein
MPSSALQPLDLYCERLGPGFWAEPLNAVSNGGFLIAAWLAWRLAAALPGRTPWTTHLLTGLLATIGIGSFLFHTLAVTWAMWADVIPIFLYQLLFLVLYLARVARVRPLAVLGWVGLFFAASWGFAALPVQWLNGSMSYGSAFVFVAGMAAYHWRSGQREPRGLALATSLFAASLTCRSLDMQVCNELSTGTHPLWHLLNAGVLYLSARALVLNEDRR